jgi:ABC-type uncharacterized transport system substrate-binding protein
MPPVRLRFRLAACFAAVALCATSAERLAVVMATPASAATAEASSVVPVVVLAERSPAGFPLR